MREGNAESNGPYKVDMEEGGEGTAKEAESETDDEKRARVTETSLCMCDTSVTDPGYALICIGFRMLASVPDKNLPNRRGSNTPKSLHDHRWSQCNSDNVRESEPLVKLRLISYHDRRICERIRSHTLS